MFIIRIVVKAIIEKEGKILLMKEAAGSSWRPGKWALPGGKLDPKETYDVALAREIKEETGLKIHVKGLYLIEELIGVIGNDDRLTHHYIFAGNVTGGKLKQADHHVAELKWFSRDEIKKLSLDDVTEYYYQDLFDSYFNNPKCYTTSIIKTWNSYKDKKFNKFLNP